MVGCVALCKGLLFCVGVGRRESASCEGENPFELGKIFVVMISRFFCVVLL